MNIVEHSKCKDCGKIFHTTFLKRHKSGIGMACIDKAKCLIEQNKNIILNKVNN